MSNPSTLPTVFEKLKTLALDLGNSYPRSPRETLGGYIIAGRALDKCRAHLNGSAGEYHFNCPLDQLFFEFSGIAAGDFEAFVATGADDRAVGEWIEQNARSRERIEIVHWNSQYRTMRISEMPDKLQLYMEDYIPQFVPKEKPVYVWFDVYDIEEKRL